MLRHGDFTSHSGIVLPFKVELDDWTDEDWRCVAARIARAFRFSAVFGIPRGGARLHEAVLALDGLELVKGYPTLIVDDVCTTGASFEAARGTLVALGEGTHFVGVCAVSRGRVPDWVWPFFVLQEWTQCRATGTG